jgi:hypothetical protein
MIKKARGVTPSIARAMLAEKCLSLACLTGYSSMSHWSWSGAADVAEGGEETRKIQIEGNTDGLR